MFWLIALAVAIFVAGAISAVFFLFFLACLFFRIH